MINFTVGPSDTAPASPQTIISVPVQTAVCAERGAGAPLGLTGLHELVPGS